MAGMNSRQHRQGLGRWQRRLALAGSALCLGTLAMLPGGVMAGEAAKVDFAAPQTVEESEALKARAAAIRDEAEARHAAAQEECYRKFLVNACLDDARKAYKRVSIEVRPMEQAVRDFERDQRQADADAKEAKRAVDAARREQEQREQAERYRADEARRTSEREQKIATKAAQAEEGRRKTAAEEADRRQRDAERARRQAERDAKKAGQSKDATNGAAAR